MEDNTDFFQRQLQTLFEWFHRHPELAWKEIETTAHIKERLRRMEGVELLDLGLNTGALARIPGDPNGPVIAIRADIDALPIVEASGLCYASENPGRMHACGHDFHTTALLGTAQLLGRKKAELPGTVILLFQPAEEADHGGERVVATGLFQKYGIRQIFGLHVRSGLPVGTIAIARGPFSAAVDRFLYRIKGFGGHASAPQTVRDPIPAAARLTVSLQEIVSRRLSPMDAAVVSVTRITAGNSWNIIPECAELEGTVRSFDAAVRQTIVDDMEARKNALNAEGYHAEFQWLPGCPATNNDKALSELVRNVAQSRQFRVLPQKPEMGGEDFSCYQKLIPGAFFHVGCGGSAPAHNARFTADPAALEPAVRLMAEIAETALKQFEITTQKQMCEE